MMDGSSLAARPALRARGLALRHGPEAPPVLAGLDLDLAPGEILAILGPSGVGKSSLLRALAGLEPLSAGELEMEGAPVSGAHPRLAMAFQNPGLLPWLDVEANVAFGLDFKHQPRLSAAERKSRVSAALEEVGLSPARKLRPSALSGGMAQRAALARCLARQPRVLLLDEPFGALDEVTRAEMQSLLRRIVADHGTAALLVTHDIDEALLLADRILLLGGAPASAVGHWRIETPRPRDEALEELGRLRLEILAGLRAAIRKL